MRTTGIAVLLAAGSMLASGQIRITGTHTVPLPASRTWMAPGWAPDGRTFFVTSASYQGLWRYDVQAGTLVQITDDPGAGFGWSVSANGGSVAYRRTIATRDAGGRMQEIVRVELATGSASTVTGGADVDIPVFSGSTLVVNDSRRGYLALGSEEPAAGTVALLGIENTKIALLQDGRKVLVDPFGDGSYIWPSLSPDGKRLLAYDMARGTFVADLQGSVLARLGRLDAPVLTRNGAWVVSMREKNDGQSITGSDLYATRADGSVTVQLTSTPEIELAPSCSPVDNRILCATADGRVLILTYEEAGQ